MTAMKCSEFRGSGKGGFDRCPDGHIQQEEGTGENLLCGQKAQPE